MLLQIRKLRELCSQSKWITFFHWPRVDEVITSDWPILGVLAQGFHLSSLTAAMGIPQIVKNESGLWFSSLVYQTTQVHRQLKSSALWVVES